MKVHHLGENGSVLNNFLAEMRDAHIQKDSLRFRTNLERVGAVFALEVSKELAYSPKEVTTPLGIATVNTCDTPLVIATILRAGLPLQKGFLSFFDHAESAFLATFRKYGAGDYFELRVDYCTTPSLEGKTLVLADTMIATGASIGVCIDKLIEEGGTPAAIHLITPIASTYAVEQLSMRYGDNVSLWVAAIDEEITGRSYIVPGLGDAGDLAFGGKR
ncbi:MAG: uracil phosphoribosyltransferase [Bacteroidales bacterium]|nr:uracil phosphoribosyltransferase [Bacteroidales bacterium]